MSNNKWSVPIFGCLTILLLSSSCSSGPNEIVTTPLQEVTTSIPQSTPTMEGTAIPDQIAIPPDTMVLMWDVGGNLFIQEVGTSEIKELFSDLFFDNFLKWQDNGCRFLTIDKGNILLADLDGNIIQSVFTYQDLVSIGQDPSGYEVFLSPDNQWIWYWEASGRPYNEMGPKSRMEIQDIKVISLDLQQGPYEISTRGGGWVAEWSPDVNRIAFSDYDEQHVLQAYVSDRNGENRIQITDFDQPSYFDYPGTDIYDIKWSPNGKKLAINSSFIVSGEEELEAQIFDIDENQIEFHLPEAEILWWIDDHTIVARIRPLRKKGIYVIDLHDDSIVNKVLDTDYPDMLFVRPFIVPELVGFYHMGELDQFFRLFIFDTRTGIVEQQPNIQLIGLITGWVTTPDGFRGIDACNE